MGGADQLALSSRAEEMKAARAALAEAPEVRAQRVAELKAQVQNGTYQVDPDKVAERILNPRG
jgi:negative regulator of flagellin synthesis FlgM